MGSMKSGALPQREMRIFKSKGAAATRNGQYKKRGAAATGVGHFKKRGRSRNENQSIKEAGALPQREMGSIKSEGAAAMRNGHFKKRGRCCSE